MTVFDDLYPEDPEEANRLLVNSLLLILIENEIRASGWSQRKAAKVMGISESDVWDLLAGRIDQYSEKKLTKLLKKLKKG